MRIGAIEISHFGNPAAMGRRQGTYTGQVSGSSDDADQPQNGNGVVTGTVVELRSSSSIWQRWVGFRFTNVDIPKGATIKSATLEVHHIDSIVYDLMKCDIHGELGASPSQFTTGLKDIQDRSRTSASVYWYATFDHNTWNSAPDISSVIQELVNQAVWTEGQPIVIILEPYFDEDRQARMETYDSDPAKAAKLTIEWEG